MIYFKRKSLWKRLISKLSKVNLPSLGGFFGFFKVIFSLLILFIIFIYSSYLFLLPKYVTDEKVEGCLNDFLKANSKLTLDIQNLKVNPDYKFDIKIKADKIVLKYKNNKDFVILQKPDIEINLITLFFKYIDLNKIKAEKIIINTNFTKNNHYDCFDYFDFNIFDFKDSNFNIRNINVICNELVFNLYDEIIGKNFKLNTKKLTFSSSGINKPVLIQTQGTVLGSDKITDFKLNLEVSAGGNFLNFLKTKIATLNNNPLIYASKFKFYTNSDINLKIKEDNILGHVDLFDFNFMVDNIQIPKNNLSLIFKGQKIKAKGDFNFIKNQFAKLDLNLDYSKNKFIELKLNSSEINLADLKKIANACCKILNLKYNFDSLNAEGILSADIYLKSNFKTITSKGFLNIQKAKLKDSATGLILNDINSNISFNNNRIDIKNTTALFDNSKFHLEGMVDNNTNLNLKINSDPINIAQIVNSISNLPLLSHFVPELNEYIFKSGLVKINAAISGTLMNPIIKANTFVTNFKLHIKSLNTFIQSGEITISASPENNTIKNIFILAKNNTILNNGNKITNNQAKLRVSGNDIIIDKTQVTFDKIKADVYGVIKNYKKDSTLELNINALLPIDNNLIIIKNKSPYLVANVTVDKSKLSIKSAKIFEKERNFIVLSGNIYDYCEKNPRLENLKITLIDKISCILPKLDNLNFEAIGSVLVNGNINNPIITGSAKLYNVVCKKYNLFIQDCDLSIKNSHLEGKLASIDIMETTLYDLIFRGNLEDNILKLTHFSADIFQGKVEGSANINIKTLEADSELILKEISIRHLSSYLKQYSIAASGRLSAFLRLNFTGLDYNSAINSLQGYIKFNIDNGELAQFAKLERFLQAGNILSQSILKLTLNSVVSSISKQNTGDFKTIEGTVKINSPMAEIQYVNTVGSNMSLHIEGKYNIINNHASLKVLGRIPQNIVSVMGNVGKFSLSQLFGSQNSEPSAVERMISTYISEEDMNKIPTLANYYEGTNTREFIVMMDGLLNNNSTIKYFKWAYKN